jgi:hypothetical protein
MGSEQLKQGHLSAYFSGVVAKQLSAVEVRPERSHQHEFNGSNELIRMFGIAGTAKHRYPSRFLYLLEDSDSAVTAQSEVTWYDARARSAARTGRSEHRLYFRSNAVTQLAKQGDLLLIARRREGSMLAIIAEGGSTIAAQLRWLFRLPDLTQQGFSFRTETDYGQDRLGLVASLVLGQIGIETDLSNENYLDDIIRRFGEAFPPTRIFSAYARECVRDVDPVGDSDATLIAWMDREEVLFRTLEKHLISKRLLGGFVGEDGPDVDSFLGFSLSVQNRRKARAGAALENHLETIFTAQGIRFQRGAVTERNNQPDFLFPGAIAYHDLGFPSERLTLLAAKTTAKDRWRQVTKEADRIALKHLLTLEPAISIKQTDQMRESGVQLVVPAGIHGEYTPAQCAWLMRLSEFIRFVRERQ